MSSPETLSREEIVLRVTDLVKAVDRPHPVRVGIDGPDAAGKTTLANDLAGAVAPTGRQVIRASVDDFQRPSSNRHARGRYSPDGYYHDSFDYAALRASLLDPLGPGGSRIYRTAAFDLVHDQPVDRDERTASDDTILIFDGVFLLRPELRDCWDLTVYLSVPFDIMVERALRRDTDPPDSAAEVEHRYRTRYIPGQQLYVAEASPESGADVVIDNTEPSAPRLLAVRT